MKILVLKFGGSSVGTIERIKKIANIIIRYTYIQIIASFYLLSIVINKFFIYSDQDNIQTKSKDDPPLNFIKIIALLAFTDLAFSIDSVTAAVAISDQLLLVVTGTIVLSVASCVTSPGD